jgi:hypothetical protein
MILALIHGMSDAAGKCLENDLTQILKLSVICAMGGKYIIGTSILSTYCCYNAVFNLSFSSVSFVDNHELNKKMREKFKKTQMGDW